MLTLKEAQEAVNDALLKQDFRSEPLELYEPIEYVLSIGGKRIRPALTLMACNLFTDNYVKALNPALGLEIFHNFTLLHDDIMDKAEVRRNQLTVHKKWSENIALLSGDAMQVKAYEYISECDDSVLKDVLKTFNKTALQICEGQQYDMNFEQMDEVSVEEYLRMIELKTSVLLAASLKIGAIIGGAGAKDAKRLYEFGRYLGLAFQLQDDMLDVYGDANVFGKKIGGDIMCNKKTFLLINALSMAKGDTNIRLNYYLNGSDISREEKVNGVREIYDRLGVREVSEKKINTYFTRALKYLSEVEIEAVKKEQLVDFAEMLRSRVY